MGPNLAHIDRRGLTSSMEPEELRKLGIVGLMLLDLRLCRRDSATIASDPNLPSVASWLPEGSERDWLAAWLSADQREDRIAGMEDLAAAEEWHDLSCHLSGWHDDLQTIQLIYARWDADAPRRNASKPRRKKEWWRVLATHLRGEGPATWDAMLALIPEEHEETLKLGGGKFEFHQRIGESRAGVKGPLVCCEFADGREPDEISFSTFERHLKKAKPR